MRSSVAAARKARDSMGVYSMLNSLRVTRRAVSASLFLMMFRTDLLTWLLKKTWALRYMSFSPSKSSTMRWTLFAVGVTK